MIPKSRKAIKVRLVQVIAKEIATVRTHTIDWWVTGATHCNNNLRRVQQYCNNMYICKSVIAQCHVRTRDRNT
jgi:hypothetical protein